ncbi:Acetyltransferase (GNAT) domain-containing protein [Pseudooceanicola antarcticus]|uniref:Acetyltransferase (GNAT) domain-containing protein n=3 Tax=Pseudooceanicola antarcticus TaxID=1247613 RepID=A0A285IW56_9RHOB|nr:Acetyltransferase (GNAT) domain-containing protein [Pseudooceanicola antarcticus]
MAPVNHREGFHRLNRRMKHASELSAGQDGRMRRHPHYARTLEHMGRPVTRLPGGALCLMRHWGPLHLSWVPEPAVLPDPGALRGPALIQAADAAQDAALRARGAIPLMTPQYRAVLDLSTDAERDMARQRQKWRNRLRHGQRQRLEVTHAPLPRDPGHWLLAAEAAQQRARGYRALPADFSRLWPVTRLFTARRGKEVLAAQLFLLHPPGASYHIGWSSEAGRAASAHNLLLWQAGRWLAARGITRLDLGVLDDAAPGLARFKLGAGARVESGGHLWLASRFLAPLGRLIG